MVGKRIKEGIRSATRKATRALNSVADQIEMALVKFTGDSGDIDFNIDLTQETVWATQEQMADLFGVDRSAINKHLRNIFDSKELDENSVCAKMAQTGPDGKVYQVLHYNLDAILSVGYRVSSTRATKFRQWATTTLRAYLVDGFALNEARLRDDPAALRRVAAKIRALRSNEKNIYAAVRECFKTSAIDYSKDAPVTRRFYARLQDKFLFAITERTASQIIIDRADHKKTNMGLQSVRGKNPTLYDAKIGKNYLDGSELYTLHILCEQFLLYAESKALRGQKLTMKDLDQKLDALLKTNDYPVFKEYKDFLKQRAIEHAQTEFALYRRRLVREGKRTELPPPA